MQEFKYGDRQTIQRTRKSMLKFSEKDQLQLETNSECINSFDILQDCRHIFDKQQQRKKENQLF